MEAFNPRCCDNSCADCWIVDYFSPGTKIKLKSMNWRGAFSNPRVLQSLRFSDPVLKFCARVWCMIAFSFAAVWECHIKSTKHLDIPVKIGINIFLSSIIHSPYSRFYILYKCKSFPPYNNHPDKMRISLKNRTFYWWNSIERVISGGYSFILLGAQ